MNQPHSAPHLPEDESASAAPSVRPKVMRRPASFSPTPGAAMPTIHLPPGKAPEENENLALSAPQLPAVMVSVTRPWQDDARFGAALLLIVLLVNLALIAWLPGLRRGEGETPPAVDTASLPSEQTDVPEVTFYSKPGEVNVGQDLPPRIHVLGGADSGPEQ